MTVHSNDGTTWLTKLERIGELSEQNRNMVFNNVGHLISADMLKEQYRQLDRNKAVGIDTLYRCSEHTEYVLVVLIYREPSAVVPHARF